MPLHCKLLRLYQQHRQHDKYSCCATKLFAVHSYAQSYCCVCLCVRSGNPQHTNNGIIVCNCCIICHFCPAFSSCKSIKFFVKGIFACNTRSHCRHPPCLFEKVNLENICYHLLCVVNLSHLVVGVFPCIVLHLLSIAFCKDSILYAMPPPPPPLIAASLVSFMHI